jgi:hypothetical protein
MRETAMWEIVDNEWRVNDEVDAERTHHKNHNSDLGALIITVMVSDLPSPRTAGVVEKAPNGCGRTA